MSKTPRGKGETGDVHVCRACGRRDTRHPSQICMYCVGPSKPMNRHPDKGRDKGYAIDPSGSKRSTQPGPRPSEDDAFDLDNNDG